LKKLKFDNKVVDTLDLKIKELREYRKKNDSMIVSIMDFVKRDLRKNQVVVPDPEIELRKTRPKTARDGSDSMVSKTKLLSTANSQTLA
jgi:hypothetical protein